MEGILACIVLGVLGIAYFFLSIVLSLFVILFSPFGAMALLIFFIIYMIFKD